MTCMVSVAFAFLRDELMRLVKDMRMEDPKPQFAHLVTQIAQKFPAFAYIHVVEPRVTGFQLAQREPKPGEVRPQLVNHAKTAG